MEGHYTPTALQSAMGEPLRSEQRINEFFPRILSRVDLLVLFIAIVLFIPNASVVQATQGAGAATYLYWVIGALTFLIPGAIVVGQLNRFMPVDGSIYVWTHRALGPLFGFFAAFCAWFPGVLVLLSATASILTLVEGIGVLTGGANANWLAAAWQQGIVVIAILLFTSWLCTLPLKLIMKIVKVVVLLYGLGIFVVGLAGIVWLLSGHAPPRSLTTSTLGLGGQSIVLYGVIVLAEVAQRGLAFFTLGTTTGSAGLPPGDIWSHGGRAASHRRCGILYPYSRGQGFWRAHGCRAGYHLYRFFYHRCRRLQCYVCTHLVRLRIRSSHATHTRQS